MTRKGMKPIILSIIIFSISFIGFIIGPILVFGIDMSSVQQTIPSQAADNARQELKELEREGKPIPAKKIDDLYKIINSQKRIEYSAVETHEIAQKNFAFFSWIPVLILFAVFTNTYNELKYFSGISIFSYFIGLISLLTLVLYIGSAILGTTIQIQYKNTRKSRAVKS
jgi:hypothetical protein